MNYPVVKFSYSIGDRDYYCEGLENEHYKIDLDFSDENIKASVNAKCGISMHSVSFICNHAFKDGDKVFGNGYQSWTTSTEYTVNDKMKAIIPIAVGRLENLAGISADCRFVDSKFADSEGKIISHCYTYVRNREDVFFCGSLSERQGFTVFYINMNVNTINVTKDIDGVSLGAGDNYELLDAVMYNGTYNEVFDRYFEAMNIGKPRIDHMSGYTSWYNYFQKIDEKIILRDLDSLDSVKDSVSVFQVDDGYETFVGDWLDLNPAKFPLGMGHIADSIHEKGYMAGIWLAPFNVQIKSRTYKEHPDWVIKDENGKPILGCVGWGGAFTLDIYDPDVREHIKHFFDVVLNKWGYDMVKLDFLYSQCMMPRNNKSRGTIMCEAMEFLRECCGEKLILGCGVPLGAAFGYVDACRISCDVDLKYKGKFYNKLNVNNEIPSAHNAIINSMYRRHLDGRAFCNDPDVFFLRYSNLKFDMRQKVLLAGINHIFGNVLFVSDNAAEYVPADVDLLRKAFTKSDIEVLSVDRAVNDKYIIKIRKDGKIDNLWFCLSSGFGNMQDILDVSVNR